MSALNWKHRGEAEAEALRTCRGRSDGADAKTWHHLVDISTAGGFRGRSWLAAWDVAVDSEATTAAVGYAGFVRWDDTALVIREGTDVDPILPEAFLEPEPTPGAALKVEFGTLILGAAGRQRVNFPFPLPPAMSDSVAHGRPDGDIVNEDEGHGLAILVPNDGEGAVDGDQLVYEVIFATDGQIVLEDDVNDDLRRSVCKLRVWLRLDGERSGCRRTRACVVLQDKVMPDRVPWERYEGEDVEAVTALFILRDNPHAIRRLPAQGDHGIDILVRNQDETWTVYQVKRYTSALNSDHKRSITKSWTRLQEHVAARGVTLRDWWVVRPRDPTAGDDEWLDELTAGSGVIARWKGRSNLDAWTTKYPEVIDYYLHGGRQEAEEFALRALKAVRLLAADADMILEQDDVREGLVDLFRVVNAKDPHYRYEYTVRSPRPFDENSIGALPKDLAWRASAVQHDVEVVTEVYRRYDLADEDSPIDLQVVPDPVTAAQQEQLEHHERYGLPLVDMPGKVSGKLPGMDLDGMTSTTITSLTASGGRHSGPHVLTVNVQDEAPLRTTAVMTGFATGASGTGWSWGGSIGGVARFAAYGAKDRTQHGVAVYPFSIEGMTPAAADAALALLRVSMSSGAFTLEVPDGPVLLDMKAEQAAIPAGENADQLQSLQRTITVVRALRTLQAHIHYALRIPNRSKVTVAEIDSWVRVADLLTNGQRTATWQPFSYTPTGGLPPFPVEFAVASPLAVRIDGRTWEFGWMRQHGVAVAGEELTNGQILLHPGTDNTLFQVVTTSAEDIANAGTMFFNLTESKRTTEEDDAI